MKVLFISLTIGTSDIHSYMEGVGSIASVLKENKHNVDIFAFSDWEDLKSLEKRIVKFKPHVIGFTAFASTFNAIKVISKDIKKKFPEVFIICGGPHIVINPKSFNKAPSLDAICTGEGEYTLLELIRKIKNKEDFSNVRGLWYRKNNKIYKNPPRGIITDLDKLPIADREIFFKEGILYKDGGIFVKGSKKRGIEFIFSRGCPFECTYCSNHALKKTYGSGYVRLKSPNRAIKEIKYTVKNYRHDFFIFHDDIFTLNHKWLDLFLKKYSKFKIPFYCNVRVETCSKNLFRKLKMAGCVGVLIGLESGDEWLRKNILNRQMSNKQIINAFKWAKEVGLETGSFVMIGFPHESPKRFLNTVELLNQIQLNRYLLYIFHPYPGTKLYDLCVKEKLFRKIVIGKNFRERTDTILKIPTFSRKDILYYYNWLSSLIELGKKRKKTINEAHRKILFLFLSKPPSSKLFFLYQLLFKIDRITFFSIKALLEASDKTLYKIVKIP